MPFATPGVDEFTRTGIPPLSGRHPRDPRRNSGGSSAGSAATVADGAGAIPRSHPETAAPLRDSRCSATVPIVVFDAEAEVPPGGEADAPPSDLSGQPAISLPGGWRHADRSADRRTVGQRHALVLKYARLVARLCVSRSPPPSNRIEPASL